MYVYVCIYVGVYGEGLVHMEQMGGQRHMYSVDGGHTHTYLQSGEGESGAVGEDVDQRSEGDVARSCVVCRVSCVACHLSCVMCHV
jgi:hypothetical protein